MATIKQIEKSLERAKKELNKYDAACKRYSNIVMKKLSELQKMRYDIQVSDLSTNPYILIDRLGISFSMNAFSLVFSAVHNHEYYNENKRKYDRSVKENATLLQQLEQAKAAEASELSKYDNALEQALTNSFGTFKNEFMVKMERAFRKHAKFCSDKREEWKRSLEEAKSKLAEWKKTNMFINDSNRDEYETISDSISTYTALLGDEFFRYDSEDEYLAAKREWCEEYWASSIRKLTEKCSSMNINKEKLSVSKPFATDKGFEVQLTDETDRVIYARLIWAAEYSDIVTPHFRYIVTERKA